MRTGGKRSRGLQAVMFAGAVAVPLSLHTELKSSSPARDERLAASPSEIRLTYTTAVEPAVASVVLRSADGAERALGDVRRGATTADLLVTVPSALGAGTYTVEWRVLGTDGHPVTGTFSFVVEGSAEPPPPVEAEPPPAADPEGMGDPRRDDGSAALMAPSYVAARWLTYASLLTMVGAVTFSLLVLGPAARTVAGMDVVTGAAGRRAAVVGGGAALFLALAGGARLLLQQDTLAMGGVAPSIADLLRSTTWGRGWVLQLAGAVMAAPGFRLAMRGRRSGWGIAGAGGVLAAVGLAMSGHASAVENLAGVAVATNALHLLAASAWLGTLLLLIGAGIPSVLRSEPEGTWLPAAATLVSTFSPRALVAAGVLVGTGALNAVFQLGALSALFTTGYGRTLLIKLAIVAVVFAAGFNNWRRTRPRLIVGADPRVLRTPALIELAAGALVLLITAVLVVTPPH